MQDPAAHDVQDLVAIRMIVPRILLAGPDDRFADRHRCGISERRRTRTT